MRFEIYPHYWVNHLSFLIRKRLSQAAADEGFDITPEEWAMLLILNSRDGLTPTALSDASVRDKTTVTRTVDKLVRKGLAERRADPDDRRVQHIHLTEDGQERFAELSVLAKMIVARSLDGVSKEDVEATVRTLSIMAGNLKKDDWHDL